MNKDRVIESFTLLGNKIKNLLNNRDKSLYTTLKEASKENKFFTIDMQIFSLNSIIDSFLNKDELTRWINSYKIENFNREEYIGIIMAGNIPLVGFHDLLCTLSCGFKAIIKPASKDRILTLYIIERLIEICPEFKERIIVTTNLFNTNKPLYKIIATGSNTTGNAIKEQIIELGYNIDKNFLLLRGSRFSYAIISGKESRDDLKNLTFDSICYFGLGCRSVNIIFIPQDYNISHLIDSFKNHKELLSIDWYINIYKRNKAILTIEAEEFIDAEPIILQKSNNLFPPVGIISLIEYTHESQLTLFEKEHQNSIQKKYCTFGVAQRPLIDEYADNIDTISFLLNSK